MGYDVRFIQVAVPRNTAFPIEREAAGKWLNRTEPLGSPADLRKVLLDIEGSRPGPDDAVDYMGKGLNFARLFVKKDEIHVENNCGAGELLKLYDELTRKCPKLLLHDLQSGRLHDAASFRKWWSRPL